NAHFTTNASPPLCSTKKNRTFRAIKTYVTSGTVLRVLSSSPMGNIRFIHRHDNRTMGGTRRSFSPRFKGWHGARVGPVRSGARRSSFLPAVAFVESATLAPEIESPAAE